MTADRKHAGFISISSSLTSWEKHRRDRQGLAIYQWNLISWVCWGLTVLKRGVVPPQGKVTIIWIQVSSYGLSTCGIKGNHNLPTFATVSWWMNLKRFPALATGSFWKVNPTVLPHKTQYEILPSNINKCQVFESKLGCPVLSCSLHSNIHFQWKCPTLYFLDVFFSETSYNEVAEWHIFSHSE